MAEGQNWMICKVSSNPNYSTILWRSCNYKDPTNYQVCSLTLSALTQILELVRGRQRTAGCFGEQRKGGEEGRADSSFLRANFVADVQWSQESKQGKRSWSTEQVNQIQHPQCLYGRWAFMLLEASQARAFHDLPSPSSSWNECLITGVLVAQSRK